MSRRLICPGGIVGTVRCGFVKIGPFVRRGARWLDSIVVSSRRVWNFLPHRAAIKRAARSLCGALNFGRERTVAALSGVSELPVHDWSVFHSGRRLPECIEYKRFPRIDP